MLNSALRSSAAGVNLLSPGAYVLGAKASGPRLATLWLRLGREIVLCPGIFAPCANSMRSTKEDRAVLGLSRWVKFDPTGTRHPWKSPPDNAADWHVVLAGSMASGPRRPERT